MMNNYKTSKLSFRLKGALLSILLLSGTMLWAQTSSYTISGKITDDSNFPVIGATVQVENSNAGTITDIDGNYSFEVSMESGTYVLIIRSIGYVTKKESITLGSNSDVTIDASLGGDVLSLDEIVVTGTGGLVEKRQLGNTIATMSGSEIAASGSLDVTAGLSGKMAGIQVMQNSGDPAGGISVRLRSASTVNGSSDPLYKRIPC